MKVFEFEFITKTVEVNVELKDIYIKRFCYTDKKSTNPKLRKMFHTEGNCLKLTRELCIYCL